MFKPRERVLRAIRYGAADRVPKGELCINDSVVRLALNCDHVGFEERRGFIESFALDIFTVSPVYPSLNKRLPGPEECLWPDVDKWTQTSLFTFAILDGAFEWGLRSYGFQEFFVLIKSSPLSLRQFVLGVEKLNLSMIKQLAEIGIDGIILADDIAFNRGLFISPQNLREYFFPSLSRQVQEIESLGLPVFFHSDGNYGDVIDDIINAGFVGLHCIDRNSGMEITDLQRKIGDKLCLWGHLDLDDINQSYSPDVLQELVISVRKLASGRRFILGTNSGLFEGMDLIALRAVYQSSAVTAKGDSK